MAPKKAVTSREAALQVEKRALEGAPSFIQPEDVESILKEFPTGVGLVRQKYRTEGGAEYTPRGKELRYDEVIAETNAIHLTMTKVTKDPRSGVLIPDKEITEFERLPFRTDNCAMVRKHRFKSVEVLYALIGMAESYGVTFEIDPIDELQLEEEKRLGNAGRTEILRKASKQFADADKMKEFSGTPTDEMFKKPGRPKKQAAEKEPADVLMGV